MLIYAAPSFGNKVTCEYPGFTFQTFVYQNEHVLKMVYCAPKFEEVEEAYWFGPVRWSVDLSVRPFVCPLRLHLGTV